MKKITICIPCYNEEDNIEMMYETILRQIDKIDNYDFEILFADNCSTDKSQDILRKVAKKDKRVKVILNSANFGPSKSSVNMAMNVTGDACISLPCDFQEPPELIPEFIKGWEEGYDIVFGQKIASDEKKFKYFLRKTYYKIINLFSDTVHYENVIGFGLMDRRALDAVLITQKQDPYYETRHLIVELGLSVKLIPYEQKERERGRSSYNIARYFDFAITSLVNTSVKPLRIMTIWGFFLSALCFFIAIVYFIYKLMNWYSFELGMAPLIIGIFFIAGVQLFSIGLLGEYIALLIRRTTKKPIVIEKEKINF